MGLFSFEKIDIQKIPVEKLLIVVLTIIAIFSIRSCRLKDLALNNKGVELQFYQNQSQSMTQEKNKLGEQITSQKLLIIDKDKVLEKQLLANSNLSSLTNHYQIKLNTLMSNVTAGYIDKEGTYELSDSSNKSFSPIMTEKEAKIELSDTTEVAVVGTRFLKEDKWFRIIGSIQKDGIKFDTLSFINEPIINIGYKRKAGLKGYFQKEDKTIEIINPNPYTATTSISNVNFNPSKPIFFKRWGFAFGLGAVVALLTNSYIHK